jgi:hypothetical protein
MVTASPTPAPTATATAEAIIVAPDDSTPAPDATPTPTEPVPGGEGDQPTSGLAIPTEALVGGVALLLVLIYIGLYLRGLAAADRYANGFVIDECPVCRRGELIVEARPGRVAGIPNARHTVRCTNCRSVLREVGDRRWRYAVDRIENSALYERWNNREVDEETLKRMLDRPVTTIRPVNRPNFVEDDGEGSGGGGNAQP